MYNSSNSVFLSLYVCPAGFIYFLFFSPFRLHSSLLSQFVYLIYYQ